MPAPYKEVWHNLMALLARDTQLRHVLEQHRAAVPGAAQMSPTGGRGCHQVAASSEVPPLPPPQHQLLLLPAALRQQHQQQQEAELHQEAPPCANADEQRPDADSTLNRRLAALPPTTPTAAGCSAGDARASLSGDDMPMTGGAVAAAEMQRYVTVSKENDASQCERLALPAPPPPVAVTPISTRDPPSAGRSTADTSGASAESIRRTSPRAVSPAAGVPGQWPGDVARQGSVPSSHGGQTTEQPRSGSDAMPPAEDRSSWLHQHALPWPVGGPLPKVRCGGERCPVLSSRANQLLCFFWLL